VHVPPIPDPEYAGRTKRGNFADLLIQMDDFTGRILDALDELSIVEDTIVVWASDNGADPNYRAPAMDPGSARRAVEGVLRSVARGVLHVAGGL
jgi:arylsulfatase A-like enzyme